MKKLLVLALVCLASATAFAEDGPVDTGDEPAPTKITCSIEKQIQEQFAGAVIDACEMTHGNLKDSPDVRQPTDTFAVDLHLVDGTKIAADLTRGEEKKTPTGAKVMATRYYRPDGTREANEFGPDGKLLDHTKLLPHLDRMESQGKGSAILFWCFAAACVGGALFVITRRNLIAAVMGMVGSFMGIAAIYMMLYAHFLAVVQMLVYAGAIMVLFVFVIMILNRPEDEPVAQAGRAGKALGVLAIVYLVGRLAFMLIKIKVPEAAAIAPGLTPEGHDWGTVKAVGTDLFNGGLFPFEAISILLLVAVVGAIAIARPLHEKDPADDKDHFTDEKGAP